MNPTLRQWKAGWRDTLILFKEFRLPLIVFTVAVIGGGLLYAALAELAGEPVHSLTEAIYIVLTAAFLQPVGEFPRFLSLQLFHFVMPVIGLIILAQGLADFGSLLFNRRARNKEWEMAVASTMNKHIVLIGLGHLGYRVARQRIKPKELKELVNTYRDKSARDHEALERLVFYAQTGFCRWKVMLEYFGEHVDWSHCGVCDNCRQPPEQALVE